MTLCVDVEIIDKEVHAHMYVYEYRQNMKSGNATTFVEVNSQTL